MSWTKNSNPKLQKFISEVSHKLSPAKETQRETDPEKVMTAARMLQISEFRFFKLAHEQWYGSEIHERNLEYIFSNYMFDDTVPHWVRHFTRKVFSLVEDGNLDPVDFNIRPPESTYEMRSAGIGYTVMLTIVVFAFCILLSGYTPTQ